MEQRSLSEEFLLLDNQDLHDVLSLPDTTHSDGSSDSEGDSRGAAAIIEALEEGSTAQGVHMGVLPQFLGAWYGSSHIAAGHTYMVDLERSASPPPSLIVSDDPQPAPSSPTAAAAAPAPAPAAPAAEPADDFEDADAASFEDMQHEVEQDVYDDAELIAAPTADSNITAAVTTEPTVSSNNTDTAAFEHAPAAAGFGRAALTCLVCAATLATLVLFLLGAAAGVSTISNTSSNYAMSSIDRHMFMVPAFHTTSTDTSKSPAAAGAHSSSSYQPQHYSSRYAGPSDRLVTAVASAAAAAAAATALPAAPGSARAKLSAPWWLGFNSSSVRRAAGRSGSTLRLPPLPPSLQRVVDGSARANITASQRLRLHLWLLHCAARNNMRLRAQQHFYYSRPSQVAAGRPTNTSALPPFRPFSSVSAGRPIPFGLQCAPSGTVQGWLHATTANPAAAAANPSVVGFCNRELAALLQPAAYIRLLQQYQQGHLPNGTTTADHQRRTAGGVQHCNRSTGVWEDGSFSAFLSFLQPFDRSAGGSANNGNSRRPCAADRRSVAAAASKAGGYSGGLLCPPAWTFACGAWAEPLVPCNASGALMVPAQHSITGNAPTATTADSQAHPATASASAAIQGISIVQPTRPVPPMYRPPLPCLLLGGPRTQFNNKTAFRPPSQHATAHHSTAHRTPTWPNTTAHRRQGFLPNRVWGVRNAAKPYGRALAISMARWGWHQEVAAAAQHKGSSSGAHTLLPMLPPVAAAATNHTSGQKAAAVGPTVGLTLPMLLGVAQQQKQQQQKPKEDGAEQACQPAVGGGLSLPMLPPVVATRPPHKSSTTTSSNSVCSAGSEFSSGLILVHHLEPPTAAKAAAAVNSAVQRAAKHAHQQQEVQDEDAADSVAGIKRQVWLYDAYDYEEVVRYAEQAADSIREAPAAPSGGCITGCADMCHGAATLCSEVCVDKCFDVPGWDTIHTAADEAGGDATAAIPLPPTTWSVPAGAAAFVPTAATAVVPLAAPLCVKNASWGFVTAAAAARGKAARAMPAQQVKQDSLLVFPPVVLQRNATAACRGPQLLLPDVAAAAAAAAAAKRAGRSSRALASTAANNDNEQDARWVSSLITLPMLPPTQDHRSAVFVASAHGHIEKCVQDNAAHLTPIHNVTSDHNDMSFDDAVTQLWLSPVM